MSRRFLVPLLLAAALPAWAQTLSQTLPNGLKIIVKEDRRAPVAVSQLWYKVGSIDEQPGKSGLSHALEHMMFKGTDTVPSGEFSRRVSALGGNLNAYTNRSETVYYENVAAANLPEVLKLEADRMQNLNFSDKDFANEMSVIREERRQRTEDTAEGKMWEQMYLAGFTKPSMRASVIGYMADLNTLKAADLRDWYRRFYSPNNAVLVIVGDVDAKKTVQTAAKLFGSIPAKPQPPRNDLSEPAEREPAFAEALSAVTRQPLVALSYRVPALGKNSGSMPYALDVLSDVLAGNSSSRLDKNLVRGRQTALSVGANYDILSRETPLFTLIGMPNNGVGEQELLAALRAEIRNIADKGISEQELKRVKARTAASEIYARDAMASQASMMGLLESRGFTYSDEANIRRRLQEVTPAEVQAAAKLLTDRRSSVVFVKPKTPPAP